ncbi:MAG: NADH:flavin oxidoreductase [Gammaproteobacteria bacterium]|nr:NADH:flavin oxidoreductase [Gammaproteobacteria bacterium]
MPTLFDPVPFTRGPGMKNRLMLSPLTNLQSHADGTLSDDEYRWLTLRAQGGFALTMTCASHVQAIGQGFPGQLGCWSDAHLPGLTRLAAGIKAAGSVAHVQLHHAGMRTPQNLINNEAPVCPSEDAETGARALTLAEVEQLREDFVAAAVRSERAGFDGVELHGAHGYILCQFLSPQYNRRDDRYGGSLDNRCRLVFEVIDGIRTRCRPDFTLGIRVSPERFGLQLGEMREVVQRLLHDGRLDYVDLSLWDVFKEPNEEAFRSRPLVDWFTDLDRRDVKLGVAGKIMDGATARRCLQHGADFVTIGRAAILHHDFPERLRQDADFAAIPLPVSVEHLRSEGLGPAFVEYMKTWKGFVTEEAVKA